MLDDRCQMFEAMPERSALPRRVLEQHHRRAARPRFEREANGVGNETQSGLLCSRGADTGMNHDAKQAERVRAIELVDEGGQCRRAQRRRCGRQVNEIAGV
jgi:hypothetical protein